MQKVMGYLFFAINVNELIKSQNPTAK